MHIGFEFSFILSLDTIKNFDFSSFIVSLILFYMKLYSRSYECVGNLLVQINRFNKNNRTMKTI